MRLKAIVLATILGIMLGSMLGWAIDGGYLTAWEELPRPSAALSSLRFSQDGKVYGAGIDGQLYSCDDWRTACWAAEPAPPAPSIYQERTIKPCDMTGAPFRAVRYWPSRFVDCVERRIQYADGSRSIMTILTADGTVWQWSLTTSPYEAKWVWLLGVLGGLVGLSGSIVLVRRRRRVS